MLGKLFLIIAAAALANLGCRDEPKRSEIILATTTSVANSGLLEVLNRAFEQQHQIVVRSHLVGSGLALAMLERGDADVAITHAPAAEADALRRHAAWSYQKLMFNDFVLVGPDNDPAAVRSARTPVDAMRRIARSGSRFISRGDGSGTHEREQELWNAAGVMPRAGQLVAAGAGMGTTLRVASESGAYTLTDRATLAHSAGTLQLRILFEDHDTLINTYAVTIDRTHAPGAAATFYEWLLGDRGRALIESFRVGNVRAFSVWPRDVPGDHPAARP